jgi:hypothetical protein
MKKASILGIRMLTAMNEPVLRLYNPVICVYADTERTEKSPARTWGFPKSLKDFANTIRNALRMPGRDKGRVTERKTFRRPAPRLLAAFSTELSIDSMIPFSFRYAKGNKARVCTITKEVNP